MNQTEHAYWFDAMLPPALAPWLTQTFGVAAYSAAYLGLRDADDEVIFQAAKQANAIIVSKDSDFLERLVRFGPPPRLLYVTCGNTSKDHLIQLFTQHFASVQQLFLSGEAIVEIA